MGLLGLEQLLVLFRLVLKHLLCSFHSLQLNLHTALNRA